MGLFDELKREMKKSFIEGMRGEAIGEDEDIDSMDLGSELVKEAFKSAREDSYDNKIKKSSNNFCPKCGGKIKSGAAFCSKCGTKVESEEDEIDEDEDDEDEDDDEEFDEDDESNDDDDNDIIIKEKYINFGFYGTIENIKNCIYKVLANSEFLIKKYNLQLKKSDLNSFYLAATIKKTEIIILDVNILEPPKNSSITLGILAILDIRNIFINDNIENIVACYKDLYSHVTDEIKNCINNSLDTIIFGFHDYAYKLIGSLKKISELISHKLISQISDYAIKNFRIHTEVIENTLEKKGGKISKNIYAKIPDYHDIDIGMNKYVASIKPENKFSILSFTITKGTEEDDFYELELVIPDYKMVIINKKLELISEPFEHILKKLLQILQVYE